MPLLSVSTHVGLQHLHTFFIFRLTHWLTESRSMERRFCRAQCFMLGPCSLITLSPALSVGRVLLAEHWLHALTNVISSVFSLNHPALHIWQTQKPRLRGVNWLPKGLVPEPSRDLHKDQPGPEPVSFYCPALSCATSCWLLSGVQMKFRVTCK